MSRHDAGPAEHRTVKAARRLPRSPVPAYEDREAMVLGPLAVLPEPPDNAARGEPHGWAVLHVSTGRALGPTLPDREAAIEAARLLANEDWAFAHPAYAAAALAEKVRSVVREVLDRDRREEEAGANQPDRAEALRPGRAA
ncbi:hypothetical protein GBA63_22565 (plasmid) [Rubrobacter tropicus]|uniref:Uncharacterized protein n=1 Tax=Rubrobacter tropicus TaxID=2653851 RepID=A0A6G8QG40_9ACTN|nr:hypothetical protein [Rubrobacter tropicus]QIN85486.1 hypothetical protein GBA63_22565 [Rubrobacter tropicus]